MKQETQDRAREEIIAAYEKRAFEMLALYSYWGNRYSTIDKQLSDMQNRIDVAEADIRNIGNQPDHHTSENRAKVKALKKDIQDYQGRINGVSKMANDLLKKATSYREEGVIILEQIEFVKAFKFNTPEEIEAKKNQPQTSNPEAK